MRNTMVKKNSNFYCANYPWINNIGTSKDSSEVWISELDMTFGQTMATLKKKWLQYKIAKREDDFDSMLEAATMIQEIQKALGLTISYFPNVGLGQYDNDEKYIGMFPEDELG